MSTAALQYFNRVATGHQPLYLDEFSQAFRDSWAASLQSDYVLNASVKIQVSRRNDLSLYIASSKTEDFNRFDFLFFLSENYMSHFVRSLNAIFASPCRMLTQSDESNNSRGYKCFCFVNGATNSKAVQFGLSPSFSHEFYDPDSIPSAINRKGTKVIVVFQDSDDLVAAMGALWEQIAFVAESMRRSNPDISLRVFASHIPDIHRRIEVIRERDIERDKKFRKARLDLHLFDNHAITSHLLPMDVWSHVCSYLGTKSDNPNSLHGDEPLPPSLRECFQTQASIRKSQAAAEWNANTAASAASYAEWDPVIPPGMAVGGAGGPGYPIVPTQPWGPGPTPAPPAPQDPDSVEETDIMDTLDGGRKRKRYVLKSRSKTSRKTSRTRKPHTKSQRRSRSRSTRYTSKR